MITWHITHQTTLIDFFFFVGKTRGKAQSNVKHSTHTSGTNERTAWPCTNNQAAPSCPEIIITQNTEPSTTVIYDGSSNILAESSHDKHRGCDNKKYTKPIAFVVNVSEMDPRIYFFIRARYLNQLKKNEPSDLLLWDLIRSRSNLGEYRTSWAWLIIQLSAHAEVWLWCFAYQGQDARERSLGLLCEFEGT